VKKWRDWNIRRSKVGGLLLKRLVTLITVLRYRTAGDNANLGLYSPTQSGFLKKISQIISHVASGTCFVCCLACAKLTMSISVAYGCRSRTAMSRSAQFSLSSSTRRFFIWSLLQQQQVRFCFLWTTKYLRKFLRYYLDFWKNIGLHSSFMHTNNLTYLKTWCNNIVFVFVFFHFHATFWPYL